MVSTGFCFIQGLVSTGFCFIQGLVSTGFCFIQGLVSTGFCFIQVSVLFRVRLKQVSLYIKLYILNEKKPKPKGFPLRQVSLYLLNMILYHFILTPQNYVQVQICIWNSLHNIFFLIFLFLLIQMYIVYGVFLFLCI